VIAAPSANKAGRPSPTRAEHVREDYAPSGDADACAVSHARIDYILDGGETERGLESTVVDVSGDSVRLLRPGAVTKEMIEAALGITMEDGTGGDGQAPLSPGMKYRHYAPAAPMTLVCGEPKKVAEYILGSMKQKRTGILATTETENLYKGDMPDKDSEILLVTMGSRVSPETIAHNLYDCLRRFDALSAEEIFAEGIEEQGIGQAIMNRLKKASGGRIVWVS
jgi:L-threonylcarbamoyladenylate synthase